MRWYAIFVKTGKEEEVKQALERQITSCVCCIPKRMVPEKRNGQFVHVVKKMFPSYVFIRVHMNFNLYYQIMRNSNALYFLNFLNKRDRSFWNNSWDDMPEGDFFKWIPDEEMDPILELINLQNDTMEYSTFCLKQDHLAIVEGPLMGMENKIKKINKRSMRAKLAIHFMGVENLVDIGFRYPDSYAAEERDWRNGVGIWHTSYRS